MKIKREELIVVLQSVAPGLAPKPILEQSDCFAFRDGGVWTFNDEVVCHAKVDLGLEGAVLAKPLLDMLRKYPDEVVDVSAEEGKFRIKAKRKTTTLLLQESALPVDGVTIPEKWRKLPDGFCEAVGLVCNCASVDASRFLISCVHLTPEFLEATDGIQIVRWPMKTGLKESTLIRHDTIRSVASLKAVAVAESEDWTFFRGESGTVMGCRHWSEEYPDLSVFVEIEDGRAVSLPKELDSVIDRAGVLSGDAGLQENLVTVELRPDKAIIEGRGEAGSHREMVDAKYDGEPVSFMVHPDNLREIVREGNKCEVVPGRLKVTNDRYEMVFCTTPVEEGKE